MPNKTPGKPAQSFLTGGGEMGARMRAHDWFDSPLGKPETWPQALRTVVGLLLGSKFPMFVAWGPNLGFLYNDAYAEILGQKHPNALGDRFETIWAEIWPDIKPLIDAAMAGEATYSENLPLTMNRKGYSEQTWFTFSYSPVRGDDGQVAGMFCVVAETTAAVLAERRQTFIVSLSDTLREISDPVELTAAAAGSLGRHLNVGRAGYGEIDGTGERVSVARDWTHGGMSSLAEEARILDAFGPEVITELRSGRTLVVDDCLTDPRTAREEYTATWESIGTRALIVAPLIVDSFLVAILFVHSAVPCKWSELDVRLVEDVGARTWAAVESARAEERLRESEARFRLMADAVPQIVWITDAEGRAEFFNKQWFDYTGAADRSVTASEVADDHVHPDDVAPTMTAFDEARRIGRTFIVEHRIRSASGAYRWFLVRGEPYRDADGKIVRWFGASVDIDALKAAETRLEDLNRTLEQRVAERTEERNMLATLVETTDIMVMAADFEFRILGLNAAMADELERVYGVRPRVGGNILGLLADQPEHQQQVRVSWEQGLAGEQISFIEEFGDPGRDRPSYEVKFRPLHNEAGEQIGAFQFVTDVTDRLRREAQLRDAREALRQAQKMEAMGQLTGGVAHDFNNLLTPIVGSLDMLQRKGLGGAREQRLIDGALQSAERARTLVQRLLAFARRQPLKAQAVDIDDLVVGMIDLIGSTLSPQVQVIVDLAEHLPLALADPNQLEMAILNLSVNARDAMPDGGTLTISTSEETVAEGQVAGLMPGSYVRLTVADTGAGMDETTLRRAIEPFFSTKGIGKGTGLGLSMVHGLTSQLGGALSIDSQSGAGTRVHLWLPVSTEQRPASVQAGTGAAAGRQSHGLVLLIDDEELVRASTADMLMELGYQVAEAASAKEALTMLKHGTAPDLIVSDHLMPEMSGVEFIRRIRASQIHTPALIVSGYAEIEAIPVDLPRLTKPFRQIELAEALTALGDASLPA